MELATGVIGAGAVVTKDILYFSVVVRSSKKIIKYRFSTEIIERFDKTQWWLKGIGELLESFDQFTRPLSSSTGKFTENYRVCIYG